MKVKAVMAKTDPPLIPLCFPATAVPDYLAQFDRITEEDFRNWLLNLGVPQESLDNIMSRVREFAIPTEDGKLVLKLPEVQEDRFVMDIPPLAQVVVLIPKVNNEGEASQGEPNFNTINLAR